MATRKRSLQVRGAVSVNTYSVISRAVEEGIAYGLTRAFKHTCWPTRESLQENIERAVMNDLCEVLKFEEVE